ncbi:MAG: bifunctional riboflavin kinase/FAD synthetase [Bacteroidales bacterium]|nr:bifunctional riboflavin kinase/FAD synthetase [Bacteroidales bacterium]MCF8456472.1 bifunctional riboflavin kinase/FAD synthetase [Bacteroidales bacterium]
MKVYHNIEDFSTPIPIVTMGMFDGVHLGHKIILDRLKELSDEKNGESVVITFWPHPRLVLKNGNGNLRYLSTIDEKLLLLEEAGVKHTIILPFTADLSQKTASEFIEEILVKKVGIKYLIAGFDHHFGKDRKGSLEDLNTCAGKFDFEVEKLDALFIDDKAVSSTLIRDIIEMGDIPTANRYLGYEYFILGKVISGNRIGRSIGFPTANIELTDGHKLRPGIGVYAVEVIYNKQIFQGMLNIGIRPTIDEATKVKSIEVHIFDFDKDIYGHEVSVVFKQKIREEKKFDSVVELQKQLEADRFTVKALLSSWGE